MLAALLVEHKWEVTVVDANPNAFSSLGDDFPGGQINGRITDEEVLRSAGLADADIVVVLTSDDVANLMAGQICQQRFNREKVLVRVRDPVKAGAFQELGLTTICPTNVELEMLRKELGIKPRRAKGGD